MLDSKAQWNECARVFHCRAPGSQEVTGQNNLKTPAGKLNPGAANTTSAVYTNPMASQLREQSRVMSQLQNSCLSSEHKPPPKTAANSLISHQLALQYSMSRSHTLQASGADGRSSNVSNGLLSGAGDVNCEGKLWPAYPNGYNSWSSSLPRNSTNGYQNQVHTSRFVSSSAARVWANVFCL